jgi:hypothetical protein
MIRHTFFWVSSAVGFLAIPMIQPPIVTVLMPTIGLTPLFSASLLATMRTTIPLPSVTTATDIENHSTWRP